MAEIWYVVYRSTDGVLIGCGTSVADPLPPGSIVRQYASRPDQDAHWDTGSREWIANIPEVLVDRLQDIANHSSLATAWSRLTTAQRTAMRRYIVWLLGNRRYRHQNDDVCVDPPDNWPSDPAQVSE